MEPKRPICGILSVALAPLGLLIGYFAGTFWPTPPAGFVVAIVILSLAISLAGLVFAVAGLARRERMRWLPVIGLILNVCIGLAHFAA
jgi:hypothetical protein